MRQLYCHPAAMDQGNPGDDKDQQRSCRDAELGATTGAIIASASDDQAIAGNQVTVWAA
jgi:hypothetical protein